MLRVSEHYISIQGEGPLTGKPTQFLRFAGCNMRCPGWPCDTQHAIDPKIFMKESAKQSSDYLIEAVEGMGKEAPHVCITGGEPFIQNYDELHQLVDGISALGYSWEVFTNGSVVFPSWIHDASYVMMDWKLPGSGEDQKGLDERLYNIGTLIAGGFETSGVKFVCKDRLDFDKALDMIYLLHDKMAYNGHYWFGAVWDKVSQDEIVAWTKEACVKFPGASARIRMNVQVHKYLWPNVEKGI